MVVTVAAAVVVLFVAVLLPVPFLLGKQHIREMRIEAVFPHAKT